MPTQKPTESDPKSEISSLADARKRRCNYGALPAPGNPQVPYANCRDELKKLCLGEKVAIVIASETWQRVMVPRLDLVEAERSARGGGNAYTSHELESAFLYKLMSGERNYVGGRKELAGDRSGPCREALGFDRPRRRVGINLRIRKSIDGVPAEKTMWSHLNRWGLSRHQAAYQALFDAFVDDHFEEFPEEMAEELRLAYWDGSAILTHRSSYRRTNRKTGEVKPPTFTGGGFRARTAENAGKDGHGMALHAALSSRELPLVARFTPINKAEGKTVAAMLRDEWKQRIAPRCGLDCDDARVMVFDSAYSGADVRTAAQAVGYLPNCHSVSHVQSKRSLANAERHDRMHFAIDGHPGWHANGHREIFCQHGNAATKRMLRRKAGGQAGAGLEGDCKQGCGHISITMGEWRAAKNPSRLARVMPGEEHQTDWKMGNPLTFNDPVSKKYGSMRFGHQEGFHGHLVTRFGLLKEKTTSSDSRQVERDFLGVFSIMHALAMEQRRRAARAARAAAEQATAPPPRPSGGAPPPPLAEAA